VFGLDASRQKAAELVIAAKKDLRTLRGPAEPLAGIADIVVSRRA
jgi:hypothetical protein